MFSTDPGRVTCFTAAAGFALVALAAGCSKQERPGLTIQQSSVGGRVAVPDTGQGNQFLSFDPATNTVTFKLVAGPFVFNGFGNGDATLTLPPKSNVVINFVQDDGTPHSAEVQSGESPIPNAGGDPAIPRAYTNKVIEGLVQGATDVMRFAAPDSGRYRIICGVPGHALSGMWIWMVIDPAAREPRFGKTTR